MRTEIWYQHSGGRCIIEDEWRKTMHKILTHPGKEEIKKLFGEPVWIAKWIVKYKNKK